VTLAEIYKKDKKFNTDPSLCFFSFFLFSFYFSLGHRYYRRRMCGCPMPPLQSGRGGVACAVLGGYIYAVGGGGGQQPGS
jgi:hypothetical protein